MSHRLANGVIRHLHRLIENHQNDQCSDRELLERFAAGKDQAAFAMLVRRHGPMVLRVCQRVLHNRHDAEDAAQAAFIVLARKAGNCRWHSSIGPWLYRVAYHLALRAKSNVERHARLNPVLEKYQQTDPLAQASGRELCAALDEELHSLPRRLQAPLVLCCLEGRTRDEAARQLGCSLATLKRRLTLGRGLLRKRLLRRGFPLAAALSAVIWNESAQTAFSSQVARGMVQATGLIHFGNVSEASGSERALALAEGLLRGFRLARFKVGFVIVLALFLGGMSGRLALSHTHDERMTLSQDAPAGSLLALLAPEGNEKRARAALDFYGDPLPPGAVSRLGTVRFRNADCCNSLDYTPDGKFLVSGGKGGARVWDASTGKLIRRIGDDLPSSFGQAALSLDGKLIGVGGWGEDKGGAVYEFTTGRLLYRFGRPSNNATPACFSPNGKVLAVTYMTDIIDLLDAVSGELLHSLKYQPSPQHFYSYQPLAFTPDSKSLIAGDQDCIRIWDVTSGREMGRFGDMRGRSAAMALSADGRQLAISAVCVVNQNQSTTTFGDNRIHIWDLASQREARIIVVPSRKTVGGKPVGPHFRFTPDGKALLTASYDGELYVWDSKTGAELRHFQDFCGPLSAMACAPNGRDLAIAECGTTIRVRDILTGQDLLPVTGHRDSIIHLANSPDGRHIATAGSDGLIYLWDRTSGRKVQCLPNSGGLVNDIAYAANGDILFSSSSDHTLHFWDIRNGQELRRCQIPMTSWADCMVLSPDGKRLVLAGEDHQLHVLDAASGAERWTYQGPTKMILAVGFSPDGQTLRAWSADFCLHSWDMATGQYRSLASPIHWDDNTKASFSPDGRYIALAGPFEFISLVSVATGKEVRRIADWHRHSSNDAIDCLAFSPDSRSLAWGCAHGPTIGLAEVATGSIRHAFLGHQGSVRALTFSKDGTMLISGADDSSALVWDLTDGFGKDVGRTLAPTQLDSLWKDLASDDAAVAFKPKFPREV